MISYEDAGAAMDWLVRAFGFEEHERFLDGVIVSHGELRLGEAVVFVASPTPDYQNPKHHAAACEAARKWLSAPLAIDGVLVFVDDIDAHFQHAQSAGAEILSPLEQGFPGRRYRVQDMEGHRWMFMQRQA